METIQQVYDLVGETDIEDKQYVAPAVQYNANTQGQCHMSMQSKTKAEGYSLWFINDCSYLLKKQKHIGLPDQTV